MLFTGLKITTLLCILLLPAAFFPSLEGGYSGKVLDSQTGEPVPGASVLIRTMTGLLDRSVKAQISTTNASGEYHIPSSTLTSFIAREPDSINIIIYEPGYEAYILMTPDYDGKITLKKTGNLVELKRIPPGFDHAAHFDTIEDFVRQSSSGNDPSSKSNRICGLELLRRARWEERRKAER